jgi:hypothetical protein
MRIDQRIANAVEPRGSQQSQTVVHRRVERSLVDRPNQADGTIPVLLLIEERSSSENIIIFTKLLVRHCFSLSQLAVGRGENQ